MPESKFTHLTQNISHHIAELGKHIPETMQGFSSLARSASKDGALDKKTKELIALSLGVAAHCKGCIGFHSESLIKLGATRQEVAEALGMSIYMGGGPSLMYAAEALQAFDEFDSTQ